MKKCGFRRLGKAATLRRPVEQGDEEPARNAEMLEKVNKEIAAGMHVYDRLEIQMSDVAKKLWAKKEKAGEVKKGATDHGVRSLMPFFFGIKHEKYFDYTRDKLARPSKSKYPDGDTTMLLAKLKYLEHLGHGDNDEALRWWRSTKEGKEYFRLEGEVDNEMVLNPGVFAQEEK